MDNYVQKEIEGRNRFAEECTAIPRGYYIRWAGLYDHLDAYLIVQRLCDIAARYAIEIKNRSIPVLQYWDDGYILELTKYNALIRAMKKGYTPLYVNYFDDARLVWQVDTIDITNRVTKKWCTATTAENYGERVLKDVVLLKPEEAILKIYN